MGWHYRPPQQWPANFLITLRQAAGAPDTPIALGAFSNKSSADALAEKFRHFRWCIRKDPNAMVEMTSILEDHHIRSHIQSDEVGHILYITASPSRWAEFIRLNPELAGVLLNECQQKNLR